jgi:hypothetical protein
LRIAPFRPADLDGIRLARAVEQAMIAPFLAAPGFGAAMAAAGPAFSCFDDACGAPDSPAGGAVICCVGLIPQPEERAAEAWALMTARTRYFMVPITRAIVRFLDESRIRRVESMVDAAYPISIRWHELMGFKRERLMPAYTPDGRDCFLYARVKTDPVVEQGMPISIDSNMARAALSGAYVRPFREIPG